MSKTKATGSSRIEPAFLFDLDGTLVDSVYQHVRCGVNKAVCHICYL